MAIVWTEVGGFHGSLIVAKMELKPTNETECSTETDTENIKQE